jgi:DNA-directed RNA polymerase subunit E'/Rpb7
VVHVQSAKYLVIIVVFRPFIGEVLTGKVLSCREDGIRGNERDEE